MSHLVEHAQRELEACGQFKEDPRYAQALVAAVAAFASYGHSGGSASLAVEQLYDLLRYRTLSPLNSDPEFWMYVGDNGSVPMWQSTRDPAAFSKDGGKSWYFVDDRRVSGAKDG